MSEKSCSVRLVTGTVILRNSKANVLFLISPITFLREHIAKYEGGTEGKKRYSEAFLSSSSNLKLSNIIRRNFMLITLRA